ncbi:hypothetical protein QVN03_25125 [Raoultella terrigena]|uniref:hypothetical protein n=1 Tax=Raoultella terrigena TaxID=577 RepID=UPI0025AED094|nr:hypothetical protein [Raoultella terrigena]WJV38606.1 hypothetical protein QVN03_25125 [Raoultella terrigena]
MANVNLTKQLEDLKEQLQAAQCGRLGARAAIAERKLTTPVRVSDVQKVTTERLREIASSPSFTANPLSHEVKYMARELLASRETQPVYFVEIEGDQDINAGRIEGRDRPDLGLLPDGINYLYTAPPAPAVSSIVNFSENADADMCREWAWEQVKELVSTVGWDAGDCSSFFSFFCWGWDMRRQYNEQRPPAPADMNHEVRDGN